ncbi:thiosulfate/3-mercaptopyruvate sulfurtransferase [Spirilliplanes yamanashiensis]|nr:thiosulfate/3-mercaptopyruvate sulfurtransferase [Spirilliplanes yamanashiensis]
MSAAALAAELTNDAPLLIDVRWRLTGPPGRADYAAGHLPGAVFLDLDADLCGPPGPGGRHPLPDPAALQAVLRAAGLSQGRPVVVYDHGDLAAASRAWWTLRWAGVEDVRVLAGGFAGWTGEVTTRVPDPPPGDVTVRPGGLPVLDAAGAAEVARDGVLVDVRAAERYRGEAEPVDPVAGHIPGAVNVPVTEVLGAPRVGVYCGSGVFAARGVLELHRAGRTDAALYAGSWSHWITDPARPVATGAEPGTVRA